MQWFFLFFGAMGERWKECKGESLLGIVWWGRIGEVSERRSGGVTSFDRGEESVNLTEIEPEVALEAQRAKTARKLESS